MATIDNLDISVYNGYAQLITMREAINTQWRLQEAASIPPQLQVLDIYPKLTELDILLGIVPMYRPWAYFFPPKKFDTIRRSPFSFSRVAPSFGNAETQLLAEEALAKIICKDKGDEEERDRIKKALKEMDKINDMLGFIIGRIGQFLQG